MTIFMNPKLIAVSIIFCLGVVKLHFDLTSVIQVGKDTDKVSEKIFFKTLKRLLKPPQYQDKSECTCGCFGKLDCPPLYDIKDVQSSSRVTMSNRILRYMIKAQNQLKESGKNYCHQALTMNRDELVVPLGGYCLKQLQNETDTSRGILTYPNGKSVTIPNKIHAPSHYFTTALLNFLQGEEIMSISDFGAGIGNLGVELKNKLPGLFIYRGFDGAPDVEEFTYGFIKYVDLTVPINVPKSEWAISINVGEHVPSTSEGLFIRNLHANNCKGIVLSWQTPEQEGIGHINLHTNFYLIDRFEKLGYIFDEQTTRSLKRVMHPESPYQMSLLIFRRSVPIC